MTASGITDGDGKLDTNKYAFHCTNCQGLPQEPEDDVGSIRKSEHGEITGGIVSFGTGEIACCGA